MRSVAEVGTNDLNSQRSKSGGFVAAQRPNRVSFRDESLDDVQSEEPPGPGHQCVHGAVMVLPWP